jgi:hypothetical protein
MTFNQATQALSAICSGAATNWQTEALNPPMGDISSVSSPTTSTEDLYAWPALPANVVSISTVAVKANARLTFAGTHTFAVEMLSNATGASGPTESPTINYAWYEGYFDYDPHTSAAWLPVNVNASYSGMEILS